MRLCLCNWGLGLELDGYDTHVAVAGICHDRGTRKARTPWIAVHLALGAARASRGAGRFRRGRDRSAAACTRSTPAARSLGRSVPGKRRHRGGIGNLAAVPGHELARRCESGGVEGGDGIEPALLDFTGLVRLDDGSVIVPGNSVVVGLDRVSRAPVLVSACEDKVRASRSVPAIKHFGHTWHILLQLRSGLHVSNALRTALGTYNFIVHVVSSVANPRAP